MADALAGGHGNRFGLLRVALAFLVIISHGFELNDGGLDREPLFRLSGFLSLGDIAVLSFFFISGFLVTASYAAHPATAAFARKRAARVLPGFAVAYLATLILAGPLTGGTLTISQVPEALLRLLLLQPPRLDGAFAGMPDSRMNNSMWTIPYEARCYALTGLLGALGLLLKPRAQFYFTLFIILASTASAYFPKPPSWLEPLTGSPRQTLTLLGIFETGACFFVFRDKIVLRGRMAALAAITFAATLHGNAPFTIGPALGGYAILWLVFTGRPGRIGAIGQKTDISYGLYLYAWPVQNTLVWLHLGLSPVLLILAATPIAAAFGYLSWTFVERPALVLARRSR